MMTQSTLSFVLVSLLLASACGEDKPVETEPSEILGIGELAISQRFQKAAPANSIQIEVSPTKLRFDRKTVLELAGDGKIPAAEIKDNTITPLLKAIDAGAARRGATLSLHASTPYGTTAAILETLKKAQITELAFKVRQGQSADVGYLFLPRFETRLQSEDWYPMAGEGQRQWDELEPIWQSMYEACRRDHYVDCAFKPGKVAKGGKMQITLWARGNGLKVHLQQFDAPEPEPEAGGGGGGGGGLIDGIAPAPRAPDAVEAEQPPSVEAAFTWRAQAATDPLSPIAGAMKPLCGAKPCSVNVAAEAQTETMRIISFLGSAFPSGSSAPYVGFQIPK